MIFQVNNVVNKYDNVEGSLQFLVVEQQPNTELPKVPENTPSLALNIYFNEEFIACVRLSANLQSNIRRYATSVYSHPFIILAYDNIFNLITLTTPRSTEDNIIGESFRNFKICKHTECEFEWRTNNDYDMFIDVLILALENPMYVPYAKPDNNVLIPVLPKNTDKTIIDYNFEGESIREIIEGE